METITKQGVVDAYTKNMARYSVETNRRRSFPDMRDGLKLVQRRIIHAMWHDLPCRTRLAKTSKVTGQVIGTYHPHGDTSVGDAIVGLCNWFRCNMPLLRSESNMGSMQGDGAAAPRYTEVMLSEFCYEAMIKEIVECPEIVDWVPNYDNTEKEPEFLPVAVPLLLINGAYGIGVGKRVTIPPHNLVDVINATLTILRDPAANVCLIPDQLMKCEIIESNWQQISDLGKGSFTVRSKIDFEVFDKGKPKEHYALIIKSTPDQVLIDKGSAENGGVIYTIYDLIEKGKLPQITSIAEDSHGNDMRIVIHLKPGSDPNYVKEFLYKSTPLQTTVTVNFEALNGIELYSMGYKAYLELFINQRIATKYRYNCIKLKEARTDYHEREMYVKILKSGKIMEIIEIIRKNTTLNEEANIQWLAKTLKITDLQAKYILNIRIKNLSTAKLPQYESEMKSYLKDIEYYKDKITHKEKIVDDIEKELIYFRDKYGRPRNSYVISKSQATDIPQGKFVLVVTENNYVKKFVPNSADISAYRGDIPKHILEVDNTQDILMVTAGGRIFKLPVYKIPICDKFSSGTDLRLLVKGLLSSIVKIIYLPQVVELSKSRVKHCAIVCTEGNCIKKLDLEDILSTPPSGIVLTKLNPGDLVRSFTIAPETFDIVIYSNKKALRCGIDSIPTYRRNTLGVSAMKTSDRIDGVTVLYPEIEELVVITESGKINKIHVSALPKTDRYKAGYNVIKLSRGDIINSIVGVREVDSIRVITRNNTGGYIIRVSDIPLSSTISGGDNKLLKLSSDNILEVQVVY